MSKTSIEQDLELFQTLAKELLELENEEPAPLPINPYKLDDKLDLSLEDDPILDDRFKHSLRMLVKHTPKTASKVFFNQLFGGRKPRAVLGELLSVMLNNSMYTYKVAGPQVLVEKNVLDKVCEIVGWSDGYGTVPTGGSLSNYMAMVMARDWKDPKIHEEGVKPGMMVYTSEDCHYSIAKNAALMGIGRENVRFIKTNKLGQMDPQALEHQIKLDAEIGLRPFMINATAGTTVMGAYDDIKALSAIAKRHELWLHVDGAFGGSVIFSKKYRHLVDGLELADSFNFNAHKMLSTPLTCSIIVTKHKEMLYHSFSTDASYLYQTLDDEYNPGKISLQCGRRNDALKFWTLWKTVGTKGLESIVDKQFDLAKQVFDYISDNPDYTVYNRFPAVTVCYNYKDVDPKEICTQLYEEAKLIVGYGSFQEDTFVRLVTINSENDPEDIKAYFDVFESFAEEKFVKQNAEA